MNLDWTGRGGQGAKPSLPERGSSQGGVRLYNERLVLSLIRRHDSLPKAEIARLTGLSAQTVSVIVRALERDGLVIKQKPQRGKVGQPLTPFALNPDGAFSLGLKVGRRSGDLMLLDLTGRVRRKVHQPYNFPTPEKLMDLVRDALEDVVLGLTSSQRARISGLGIAAPFELWNWEEAVDAPSTALAAWRGFDLAGEIAKLCPWPVHFSNDATAACAAELLFGRGARFPSYAYVFLSYFAGGGVVINGSLFPGRSGNAGALGALPMPGGRQLLHAASLYVLENAVRAQGGDPMLLARSPEDWSAVGPALERWLDATAEALAYAAAAAMAVIEFDAIVIDGAMPADVRTKLVAQTRQALLGLDTRGLPDIAIEEGLIGSDARAMGAASLALFANYMTDRDVLFKETT
jgi:predicted NBD/HSP70 family sugar kinase/biotin operon repressor